MLKKVIVAGLLIGIVLIFCTGLRAKLELPPNAAGVSSAISSLATYEELVDFFVAWREFQAPKMFNGVPDYTQEAMARQHRELADWQSRLAAIDTTGWSIAQQIDWYLVWAEMNGLDFAHRVKKPWSRSPAFYVWFYPSPTDVPEREGPNIHGNIELPNYNWPLSAADAREMAARLRNMPEVLNQARTNLTGDARDLWVTGTRSIREQSDDLESFAESATDAHPDLAMAAREARDASNKFADWLDERAATKMARSGVGKNNYTWNLRNVHLLPYSWEDEVLLMQRELARSHSSLRLEENRNRDLPKLPKIDNAEDYDRLLNEAVTEYMEFLTEAEIVPIKDYMDAALRERMGSFTPSAGLRGFFWEIIYRSPITMRTHHYHWFDLARMRHAPHESPIRRTPLLYNIFDGRAEGMATSMEEMMMHAGMLDDKPRARELIWILLAQRAARGLGGLYQHGLEMTLDEAAQFASKWTPWSLLPADGATIQHEEQFYLEQPAYGTSYVIGKIEIEKLIAEYARQRAGNFVLKEFMDDFNRAGVIPVSLIYWELTGNKSMLEAAIGE
ncbi:DUF885 family protein [candidate division KSB1 bacterium]|nr:DUF885 family protein [candidate division KSB1 bacterium]